MVCFADSELDAEVRRWSWLGIDRDTYTRTVGADGYRWEYDVVNEGYKYHGNSVMAAMGLVSLRYVEEDNDQRRRIADWYDEFLDNGIDRVPVAPRCEPSRHLYQILVDHRDEVMVGLNGRGIYPGLHYRDNTFYRMYDSSPSPCPRARAASARLISLPLHLHMSRDDVRRVAESVGEAISEASSVGR